MYKHLLRLAILILALAATGTLVWDFVFNGDHDTILGLTAFAIGIVTLFGFMQIYDSPSQAWSLTKRGLRTALAASIIVTYLFLVAFETFLVGPEAISPLAKMFVDSFTTVVSVTIAFYFGATAVLQAFGKSDEDDHGASRPQDGEK